jgi:hypothetical protein
VSAIATLLGLLLVVTVLANYLATQLPAQMAVNDANRTALVEDQITRLAGGLEALAQTGRIGGIVTQPITLGSLGAPPFGPPDGATIGPLTHSSKIVASFTLSSGGSYSPPTVGAAGGTTKGAACTTSSTSLTCSNSGGKVYWNFTTSSTSYTVSTSGGPYHLGFQTSQSRIAFTASSSSPTYLVIVGNGDNLTLTVSGATSLFRIWIFGNYDTVAFAAGSWSNTHVSILAVGTHDKVTTGAMSMSSSVLTASFYGTNDSVSLGTTSSSNSAVNTYFTGFDPENPAASCPVDNLAVGTDSVGTGGATSGNGKFNVTYNDSSTNSGTAPPAPWTATFAEPMPFACPFYKVLNEPVTGLASTGGSFEVTLRNTYIPNAYVAFDQGAVVYAEAGGAPLTLIGPQLVYTTATGELSLWIPEFASPLATESGSATAVLSARLASLTVLTVPEPGYTLTSAVSLSVTTPFATAWEAYFTSLDSPVVATCEPAASAACTGGFESGGPIGTVYLNATVSSFSIDVATYALSVN